MDATTLQGFTGDLHAAWGPLTTELVETSRRQMERLLAAPVDEPWLGELRRTMPAREELHRDPEHGFVLLAHGEQAGLYRPPHDHGRSWVIYGVQYGEVEMGTYARIEGTDGAVRLVRRGTTLVRAGEAQVYLPGDVHDTRCLSETALLFRFSERDLRAEDLQHGRVTRYVERNGTWVAPSVPA